MQTPTGLRRPKLLAFVVWVIAAAVIGSGAASDAAIDPLPVIDTAAEAAALGGLIPDVIEQVPTGLFVEQDTDRSLLRFSTTHWNFGNGPLQVRGGDDIAPCVLDGVPFTECTYAVQEIVNAAGIVVGQHPAGAAIYHPTHNHWHQDSVVTYAIRRTLNGPAVGPVGTKTSFCLIDVRSSVRATSKERTFVACNADRQGVSVGWGDQYTWDTSGQSLDVTALRSGDYYLTFDADPDQHWIEKRDDNNRSWVKFRMVRRSSGIRVRVLQFGGYRP
jgi:hypothetical protein